MASAPVKLPVPSIKIPVTITYTHQDAQPPVYLAGSFSDPPWHPQEMKHTKTDDDRQFHFFKEVLLEPGGTFQYKFRLGPGEWWVLDETAPVVVDAVGNRNNVIIAPPPESHHGSKASDAEVAKASEPAVEDTPIPILLAKKTGTEPRHGNDFGSHATIGQKDAHDVGAADLIRPDTDFTDEMADTAAEIAESAASIDMEPSPLPLSDEEAGRTGERRLSVTPIGEVADTASEVADSAALVDRDTFDKEVTTTFPHIQYLGEEGMASGAATPREDKAPLFAYECVGPCIEEENEEPSPVSEEPTNLDQEEEFDPNDPLLEEFPNDRMQILTKISSTESRLNADQTRFEGIPISPVIEVIRTPIQAQPSEVMPEPSLTLDLAPSPLLDNIEEDEEEEVLPAFCNPIVNVTTEDALGGATKPLVLEVSGNTKGKVIASPLPPGTTIELNKADNKSMGLDNQHPIVAPEARAVLPSGDLTGTAGPSSTAEPMPYVETLQAMKSETLAAEDHSMEPSFGAIAAPYPGFPTTNELRDRNVNSHVEKGAPADGKPSTPAAVCQEPHGKSVAKENLNIHPKSTDFGEPAAFVATGKENTHEPSKTEAPAAELSEPTIVEEPEHGISKIPDPISATEPAEPETLDISGVSTPKSISSIAASGTPTSRTFPSSSSSPAPFIPGQFPGTPSHESGTSSALADAATRSGNGTLKQRHAVATTAMERPLSAQELRPVAGRGFLAAFWDSMFVGWIGGWMRRIFGGRGPTAAALCLLLIGMLAVMLQPGRNGGV